MIQISVKILSESSQIYGNGNEKAEWLLLTAVDLTLLSLPVSVLALCCGDSEPLSAADGEGLRYFWYELFYL